MDRMLRVLTIRKLHDPEDNPYRDWSAAERVSELERLRQEYIRWKYPDAEPRLQRVVTIIQRTPR